MKYIIKNCDFAYMCECGKVTDCLLKQIVEKCCEDKETKINKFDILGLLEIEEINE